MSARKRRAARKIAMLVRMDGTRSRMKYSTPSALFGHDKAIKYWESCMVALGVVLARKGLEGRARMALDAARDWRLATGGAA